MGKLKVLFLSFWAFNPYQKILIDELVKQGIEAREIGRVKLLPGTVLRWKPHILHIQNVHPLFVKKSTKKSIAMLGFLALGLFIVRVLGVRIIWTAHDLKHHRFHSGISHVGSFLVSRMAHTIITHCEAAQQEVATYTNLKDDSKLYVVPHANYIGYYENRIGREEARRRQNITNSALVFLFIGRIRKNKGIIELIEAFKQLPQKQVRLIIAGKAQSADLDKNVRTHVMDCRNICYSEGFVPENELQVYLNACDVVAIPYRDILTSGVALLAMSFGRTCIASRRGCLGEVLGDGGAFLFDPDAKEGLLKSMKDAIASKHTLERMGERNRKMAERWSWGNIAGQTMDVYVKSLESRPGVPGAGVADTREVTQKRKH